VTVAPPFEVGAVQETTDCPFTFDVARTVVGAPGTVDGTAAAEAAEATDAPLTLLAVTVNVYDLPFVRPLTKHEVAVSATQVYPTTVKVVSAEPPFHTGAVHDTTV
jgi:hypothetical protein